MLDPIFLHHQIMVMIKEITHTQTRWVHHCISRHIHRTTDTVNEIMTMSIHRMRQIMDQRIMAIPVDRTIVQIHTIRFQTRHTIQEIMHILAHHTLDPISFMFDNRNYGYSSATIHDTNVQPFLQPGACCTVYNYCKIVNPHLQFIVKLYLRL